MSAIRCMCLTQGLDRIGLTLGGNEVTVRSLAWMIAGHELWHRERLAKDHLGQ